VENTVLKFDLSKDTQEDQRKMIAAMYPAPREAPLLLSVVLGEIVYNLRSGLDYLVYSLAAADAGTPRNGTQFPIEDSPAGFSGRRCSFLMGLSDKHVAMIEDLQPYKGVEWTRRLRDLSNPDKHRRLTIMKGKEDVGMMAQIRDDPNNPLYSTKAEYNPDALYVRRRIQLQISLEDGAAVIDTARSLKEQAAKTLKTFESEF
jgi:hypothetical protein